MSQKRNTSAAAMNAIDLVCRRNFHRCLFLPKTASHERLRITYATTSNFENDALPVALWCGPMFASRYHAIGLDHIAKEIGVRVICIDRPGFGGSSSVPLEQRMSVWLELVPILLAGLDVRHVSLVSHSAGTTYLLNTLYLLRSILHPTKPSVFLMAPWVHGSHSNAALMKIVDNIPNSWVNSLSSITRFVNERVVPAGDWSGGALSTVSRMFQRKAAAGPELLENYEGVAGLSFELANEIGNAQMRFLMMEDMKGYNDEAIHCLKKSGTDWGVCDDYPDYIGRLYGQEEARDRGEGASKLKVQVFFAESDLLIGKGGQEYWEKCWRSPTVDDHIDYRSIELPDTSHDSIVSDKELGAVRRILEEIQAS